MKKLFTIIFTVTTITCLNSCFLFKPVQKTCPAYSEYLKSNSDNTSETSVLSKESVTKS
jgi:hypothetical protein